MRGFIVRLLFVLTLLATVTASLTGCAAKPCTEQDPAFVKDVQGLMQEWQDASTLAGSTPRASLAVQIAELQRIRRATQALTPPDCGKPAQAALVTAMDAGIDGFTAFLSQATEADVQAKFTLAASAFTTATEEIGKLSVVPK